MGFLIYMRKEGFEPSSLAAHAPQTCAYASSATSANGSLFYHKFPETIALLGLEPKQTTPEAVVLPLHHRAKILLNSSRPTPLFKKRSRLIALDLELNSS